jgi:PKD repeat protein
MSKAQTLPRRLLPALAGCLLLLLVLAATAGAEGFGEVAHFGGEGTANGKLKVSTATNAFGVDPQTDTVFVGDEPKVEHEHEYRIQELGDKGEYLGSTLLEPQKVFKAAKLGGEVKGIEGIAVDATNELIYVLAVYERAQATEEQEEKHEEPIDEDEPAAGVLYAFKVAPNNKKLEPAPDANSEGVLATPVTLKAQGEKYGEALLEPTGITVDSTTGEVIILGEVEEKVGAEEQKHIALQRVKANGELGARYVDPVETGEEEAGEAKNSEPSNSPVVSQTGQVYVQQAEQVVQIPKSFAAVAPTPVFQLKEATEALLTTDTGRAETGFGGGLSILPEGSSGGRLYTSAEVKEAGGTYYWGALALHYAESGEKGEAAELGWTGGGNLSHGAECVIGVGETKPELAAGKDEQIFVLDSSADQVVEFGPGGKGCPTASASALSATVNGQAVSEVPSGTEVKLSSTVTQANALSVEWNFGEGEPPQIVGTDEHQTAEVTHKFEKKGEHTITETIHTDNLATPELKETKKLTVESRPPTAHFSYPSVVTAGEAVKFNGEASSDPNGAEGLPLEYAWNFGDGSELAASKTATATHTYGAAGIYTVKLTVMDKLGNKAVVEQKITVDAKPTTGPEHKEEHTVTTPPVTTTPITTTPVQPTHDPDATLASTSLSVSSAGALAVQVTCPAGETSCEGTVTLRTLSAVSAAVGKAQAAKKHKSKPAILTLASGSFTVAGGKVASVTLHLSAKARALLARTHLVRAQATLVAHDAAGATHTTQITVTLRPAKSKHHHG